MAWACSGLGKECSNASFKVVFLKIQLHLKGEVNSGDQCPEASYYGGK